MIPLGVLASSRVAPSYVVSTWSGGAPSTQGYWAGNTWKTMNPPQIGRSSSITQQAGFRWASMPIPPGSTITAATLAFTTSGAQTNPGAASNLAGVHQVDAAPAPASGHQTTAWSPTAAWSPTNAGAKSVNLTAAIQALVDRPGWTKDNPVVVRVQGNTTGSSGTADLTGVTLTVDYESPG